MKIKPNDTESAEGGGALGERGTAFGSLLLNWDNPSPGRGLPWAFESDPYKVWVSEIMLQQTQAATVVPYYLRFTDRFPDVISLAGASLDEVLRIWAGLGYYSRARNLYHSASLITDRYDGVFPQNFTDVLSLPGVGRSTAGAICALAYGLQTPILDGNAKRVYARCFCVDDEKQARRLNRLWNIAEVCTPKDNCQQYTQSIMDIGATVCTPKNPSCELCPVASLCCAKQTDRIDSLPLRKSSAERKIKSVNMVIVLDRHHLLLERRPPAGIWSGLWSFPEFDGDLLDLPRWFRQRYAMRISVGQIMAAFHHDFTHYRLNITPILARIENPTANLLPNPNLNLVSLEEPLDRGVPAPVAELIERIRLAAERQSPTVSGELDARYREQSHK